MGYIDAECAAAPAADTDQFHGLCRNAGAHYFEVCLRNFELNSKQG